jgi:sulfur carrier protein
MQFVLPKGKVKVFFIFFPLFSFAACSFPEVFKNVGMNISINQQPREIPDQCSLEQLLTQVLGIPVAGLAVAVDQTVIPSTAWPAYILREADKVMLIRATQGG